MTIPSINGMVAPKCKLSVCRVIFPAWPTSPGADFIDIILVSELGCPIIDKSFEGQLR